MLTLYQIGSLALHLKTEEDRWDDYRVRARQSATPLLAGGRFVAPDERYMVRLPEMDIEGKLLGSSARSTLAFDQQMRGYIGLPTTLIAYIPRNEGGSVTCAADVIWLQATGRLTDYSTSKRDNRLPEVRLQLEVLSPWRTLDPFLWEPGPGGDLSKTLMYNRTMSAPYTLRSNSSLRHADWMLGRGDCVAWWYTNPPDFDYLYDPEYWETRYNNGVDAIGGSGSGWDRLYGFKEVFINPRRFNGPPVSVYAFRGMTYGTTLRLRTVRDNALRRSDETTTVDVSALHDTLVDEGYGGIESTDVLITGDVQRLVNGKTYRPAFLLRDGDVVEVQLAQTDIFSYEGDFPGQLSTGLNRFMFDVPALVEVAYVHIFQRL